MGFKIMVTGDFACFTRPEMKVERVSYDVPTPSAIEGMLKCIYWKPAIKYVIDKIIVYNPIRFINIRRNELKEKTNFQAVKKQMKDGSKSPEQFASELRTQRGGMLLRDVKYGIEFHFELTGIKSDGGKETDGKHLGIIERRLSKGKHFRQPYLGCREFSVRRVELVDEFDYSTISNENKGDIDLGFMLYGLNFKDKGLPLNNDWDNPVFSDDADPVFYRPHMVNGVIDVQKYKRVGG